MVKIHTYTPIRRLNVLRSVITVQRLWSMHRADSASSDNSSLGSPKMKCNTEMSFVKIQIHKYKR